MNRPRPNLRALRAAVVALVLAATTVIVAVPASAASYVPISGSGSTWSQNALDQWRRNVAANYGMTVNFSGTGSSAGRQDFIKGSVDFAVSEIPFQAQPEDGSPPENPPRGFAYMPIVAGGTAFMYNLKIGGKQVTDLQLSGDIVTRIFTGEIKNWNDPAIQADNPSLTMPDVAIVPVVRSDGSGSSAQFTLWMSKQHGDIWTRGMTSQFPLITGAFKGQSGSLGVSGYVGQNYSNGAITYVEYSYALKSGFPVAKVKNASGGYVLPTAANVAIALTQAQINDDLTQRLDNVYNYTDPSSYPLSSYSYMIVPTEVGGIFTEEKGNTLGIFAKYMVCDGQTQAEPLGYSPLPKNLVQAAFDQIKRIPGANVGDLSSCGAANAETPIGDSGGGDDGGGGGTGGGTTGTTETAAAAANTASGASSTGAVYDANGNLVSGGTGGGTAVSAPFSLESAAWGPAQVGMLIAGALLLMAVLLPPFFSRGSARKR